MTWLNRPRMLAEKAGFFAAVDNSCDDWDYADAARYCWNGDSRDRRSKRFASFSVGEVTVTMKPYSGSGRQEPAVCPAMRAGTANHPGELLTVLSAGSDGIDGNTRSAEPSPTTTTVEACRGFWIRSGGVAARIQCMSVIHPLGDAIVTGLQARICGDLRLLMSE